MNRIEKRFEQLRRSGRRGFIVYIGAGDPDLETTRRLTLGFDRIGVDIVELGVPFSDPLADGLVNQLAAQRGLASGTTPSKVLVTVAQLRRESEVPIVLYLYYNLIHRPGLKTFIKEASEAGVDGLLVLDLPPEEAAAYDEQMKAAGMSVIYLIAPTTPEERMEMIAQHGSGFLYYVSREGVTGMQSKVSDTIATMTARLRRHTRLPIAVGFGISNPGQAREVAACAEAVVVGSAVVNQVGKHGAKGVDQVLEFTRPLVEAVKSVRGAAPSELNDL